MGPNSHQPFVFEVLDFAYPLQTSSTAHLRSGINRPTGYRSLIGTNWVCKETITSTLHIVARAQGWGLQAMPPQPHQTVWIGTSSWSKNLLTEGSGRPLIDPVYDAGVTGSVFGPKPKPKNATHETRMALLNRTLQVTVVYIPFNIHSNHWVYFKIEFVTNTITIHDPLPPQLSTQAIDTKRVLHRPAEWMAQVKYARRLNSQPAPTTTEPAATFSGLPTRFCTVTSITQKNVFQCALYCIGNILADALNKSGRVRHLSCEKVRKWVGLLLWLNSRRPIALTSEQKGMLIGSCPLGAVVECGNTPAVCVMPDPRASSLIDVIIRHMMKAIGDTPSVATASLLPDGHQTDCQRSIRESGATPPQRLARTLPQVANRARNPL